MWFRCVEHAIHLAAHHLMNGIGLPTATAVRKKIHKNYKPVAGIDDTDDSGGDDTAGDSFDADDFPELQSDGDDNYDIDESMEVEGEEAMAEPTEFDAGDIIGKVLAMVNQVD